MHNPTSCSCPRWCETQAATWFTDCKPTDFVIEDDGVEQKPFLDEAAEAEPVSLMIAVQCGRRARREFDRMRGLPSMLEPVLSQSDTQTALVFFDSKLNLVHDFTHNSDMIETDLKTLEAGDNGAAILDAVAYSVKLLNQQPEGRQRVLLLISETRDHGSHFAKLDDVVKLIGVANVAVYALPFSPVAVTGAGYRTGQQSGRDLLGRATRYTRRFSDGAGGDEEERVRGDCVDERRRVRTVCLAQEL